MTLSEIFPFLIPLIIIEIILLIITLKHILSHDTYKYGNRILWIIITVVGVQFIGPILYFIFGRED